jgi:hypothetical protein
VRFAVSLKARQAAHSVFVIGDFKMMPSHRVHQTTLNQHHELQFVPINANISAVERYLDFPHPSIMSEVTALPIT